MRFGVIGTGHWAEHMHLAGLKAREDVELVGLWGRAADKASALARAVGTRSFARFEDLLAEVDALSFAVPPAVQAELAPAAARAGKHLLLEKPLALSPAGAATIVRAVEASRVGAVVFFTRVFTAPVEDRIQALAAQGPWDHCRAYFHAGALRPGSPYAGSIWRQQADGALWDLGPHLLSVLLPILGPISQIRASEEAPGLVRLQFRHRSGATSEADLTLVAEPDARGEAYALTASGRREDFEIKPAKHDAAYAAAISALLRVAAGEAQSPRYGIHAAAEITTLLDAAWRSIEQGVAISID